MGVIFLVKAFGVFELASSVPVTGVGFWDFGSETGTGGGRRCHKKSKCRDICKLHAQSLRKDPTALQVTKLIVIVLVNHRRFITRNSPTLRSRHFSRKDQAPWDGGKRNATALGNASRHGWAAT